MPDGLTDGVYRHTERHLPGSARRRAASDGHCPAGLPVRVTITAPVNSLSPPSSHAGPGPLPGRRAGATSHRTRTPVHPIKTLRRDLVKVAEACGVEHPGLIDASSVEVLEGRTAATPLHEVYGYQPDWGLPSAADRAALIKLITAAEPQGGAAPPSPAATG